MVHQYRREGQAVQERVEALIRLASEQGFPLWVAWGTFLQGWVLAEQGQAKEGIVQVRWGLAAWQDTGAEVELTYFLNLLAEAYGKAGQADKGLAALADAPALVEKTGDRRWEAEVYRLKGELVLASGVRSPASENSNPQPLTPNPQKEAEACFLKAIEVARHQQAKSLELRAVMSLVRLRQQQAAQPESCNTPHATRTRLDEAYEMLSEVYHWFTEGFDTKDLQEAKALVEALT
jgi:predicted ATPase